MGAILLSLAVLAVLGVALLLAPPHLQIRRIEPALPSEDELRTLLASENGPRHVRFLGTASQEKSEGAFGHVVFHVEWPDGRAFMVDASIYQTPWQVAEHNLHTKEGAEIVEQSCLRSETVEGNGLLTLDAFPGLGIVALAGHTPGSTPFAIASRGHLWLLSGDIVNAKADLLTNRGKGFLYSYVMVPENTRRTEVLRRWLADLDARPDISVIVSHDFSDIESSGMPVYSK